jgi:pilus assembly protein CpaE
MSDLTAASDLLNVAPLNIAVVSPDERRRNAAVNPLHEFQDHSVQEFTSYPSGLNDALQMLDHDFDVVLIDADSDPDRALSLAENVSTHNLGTAMVYSEENNPELVLRSMRAGAREFLTIPFAPGTMAEALSRATALSLATHPKKAATGKLLVFLSAKGGLGVTTLACNYALALAQCAQKKTLFIDLNFPLGDAAILLGIHTQYSTANAIQNANRLDFHFLSTLLVKHESGLSVLAAPSILTHLQVPDSAIDKLLRIARQEFDYVVVDVGSGFSLQNAYIFDEASVIYLVAQIGVPELRNSNRLITQFSAQRNAKLEIVINRYNPSKIDISDEQIARALTRPVRWKVPNDYVAVQRMQNTAAPLIADNSRIAQAIRQMARSVCDDPAVAGQKSNGKSWFKSIFGGR